jgi:hypothetical protein
MFKKFKPFNRSALFKPPPISSPTSWGSWRRGNVLNLNVLNVSVEGARLIIRIRR